MLEYVKQWTGEYFNEVLQNARKTHPDYETAIQERIRHSKNADGLLSSSEKDLQMQAYISSIYHVAGLESELLYFQGYLDCMELLRFLRVV
jgi:hypothetical protein